MTPKKDILFPQKPVMIVYRAKLLSLIKKAMKKEKDWQFPPDSRENRITSLLNKLGRQPWVVHFCKRYDHADGVAKYLSRYVKSGPLKNKQIRSVTAEQVKYHYYSHQNKKTETLTLPTGQFIQRLLQHAPIPGKPTVRYSGLYHSATRKKLNLARAALGQAEVSEREIIDWQQFLESKDSLPVCTTCGLKLTKMVDVLPQQQVA